jgi:hypothetical protein
MKYQAPYGQLPIFRSQFGRSGLDVHAVDADSFQRHKEAPELFGVLVSMSHSLFADDPFTLTPKRWREIGSFAGQPLYAFSGKRSQMVGGLSKITMVPASGKPVLEPVIFIDYWTRLGHGFLADDRLLAIATANAVNRTKIFTQPCRSFMILQSKEYEHVANQPTSKERGGTGY